MKQMTDMRLQKQDGEQRIGGGRLGRQKTIETRMRNTTMAVKIAIYYI